MANYSSTANVVVTVNGKQAQQMFSQLEKQAKKLEVQIDAAAKAGDKTKATKLQRELKNVNKLIDQLKNSTQSVEKTLMRLDKASPRELNKALRTLQQQLNGIQRGTAAWDAHVAKIKRVKAELQKVNATLLTQESTWRKFNKTLNYCQTAIMASIAALTGLVMAGRRAVNAYASMEEQLANTQKYTRMSKEEVEQLNQAFMKMDTRIAREQLNELAQEGGRLGYNTVESVKEYVEAASIINVALVDLGEGATQTIAKLTNIFGIEDMYGVRDAMLKVGSTVNHLSQNCTASKQYLVDFAQRLAGIGSTAKMTVPEIIAFGATLDAHGQKVEMSATALQRVVMALFQDTSGMAKKVGLDVKEFTKTLNTSTTQGVMMFLEALKEMGSKNALAVLSPLFKDLGLDGVRVSGVLANLAEHLDFLKWQMGEAAQAFREGTSATKEFEIFNNTVQARIDKARNKVHELAVELGEKLYPLMSHIYTSTGAFLRILNSVVDFIIKYRVQIMAVVSAFAAYYSVLGGLVVLKKAWNAVVAIGTTIQKAFTAAIGLAKAGVLLFSDGLRAATVQMRALSMAIKANPFGLLAAAVAGAVTLFTSLTGKTNMLKEAYDRLKETAKDYIKEVDDEKRHIYSLFESLKKAGEGTDEYKRIKNQIISQYGTYLRGLSDEISSLRDVAGAYEAVSKAAQNAAKARALDKAKEKASETYYDMTDEYRRDLFKALQRSKKTEGGKQRNLSEREIQRLMQIVEDELATGVLTEQLKASLRPLGVYARAGAPKTGSALSFDMGDIFASQNSAGKDIADAVNVIAKARALYNSEIRMNEAAFANPNSYLEGLDIVELQNTANKIRKYINDRNQDWTNGFKFNLANGKSVGAVSRSEAEEIIVEIVQRINVLEDQMNEETEATNQPEFDPDFTPYESEKDRKKREKEAKAAAIKAKKEFKAAINEQKEIWERDSAINNFEYKDGFKSYSEFIERKKELDIKYFDDRLEVFRRFGLEEDEDYQELLKKKSEAELKWQQKFAKMKEQEAKIAQKAEETQAQMDFYTKGSAIYQDEEALNKKLFEIRVKYLKKMRDFYNFDSEEYYNYNVQLAQEEEEDKLRKKKLYAEKFEEWYKNYSKKSAEERYKTEETIIKALYKQKMLSEEDYQIWLAKLRDKYRQEGYNAEDNREKARTTVKGPEGKDIDFSVDKATKRADKVTGRADDARSELKKRYDEGLISAEEYKNGMAEIGKEVNNLLFEPVLAGLDAQTRALAEAGLQWANFFKGISEGGKLNFEDLANVAAASIAVINSGLETASEFLSAQKDIELATIEKRYDREIELAQGNSYKVAKAEKEKEAETQRIKAEYARKEFALKVAMAIGQTATNALMGYAAGLQAGFPMATWLAPLLAGLATAQGLVQVALLKKQQQAAEAQGYMSGGFTPDGRVDEVAGVVHAGEWVASQKLTKNPQARPLIEALDYAQRTNTIGSIRMADVSRSVTAPMVLASRNEPQVVVAPTPAPTVVVEQNKEYAQTMRRLSERLNEPFAAVVTVTGDKGIVKAQNDYDKLIRNKNPKYK